jgi:tetratricopeptide (TPR) repeat protein
VKRDERKFLKDPDEFILWSSRVASWAQAHRPALLATGAAFLGAALIAGILGWRSIRQAEAASEAFRLARTKFVASEYAAAALDFDTVARDYPGTAFGRLAMLYRGYCLARTGDAGGAVLAFQDFLARMGSDPYLRQLALTNLAQAQDQAGLQADARKTALEASAIAGPYRIDALLTYARLSEAAGDQAAAVEAYRKVLAEDPDADTRTFVQRRLPAGTG